MEGKQTILVLDFDGTITTKDTFLDLILFEKGFFSFIKGIFLCTPFLIGYKLHLYPNWKAKQKLFSFFFKGKTIQDFNRICINYADKRYSGIVKIKAESLIRKAKVKGEKVIVVSASALNWVKPIADRLNVDVVISTELEVKDGLLTGYFSTPNCYGIEKVNRLKAILPNKDHYKIVAYGDSNGDRELLAYADEAHYKEL